jgi:hypothetical protein
MRYAINSTSINCFIVTRGPEYKLNWKLRKSGGNILSEMEVIVHARDFKNIGAHIHALSHKEKIYLQKFKLDFLFQKLWKALQAEEYYR